MAYNRAAVVNYARRYWNRPCDDGKVETKAGQLVVSQIAPGPDWEAWFAEDGVDTLVFKKAGETDRKTRFNHRDYEDCTHYINRCLIQGGMTTPVTAWAPTMAGYLINRSDTKVLGLKVPVDRARRVMDTGMVKEGDVIAYWGKGDFAHMAVRVEAKGISCHTFSRYDDQPFGETWELPVDNFLYTFIHFSADDAAPSGNMLAANGWWVATATGDEYYYYLLPNGKIRWTDHKPMTLAEPPADSNQAGYWFDMGGKLLIIWRATGSVEQYQFESVTSSYNGTWYYGASETPISMERLV